jgi:polyhydroxyalkanoate synthesis regulator phasin
MDAMWMAKQLMDFQKTTFDNTYKAVVMVQDQSEKVANTLIEQANLLPEEGRQVIGQWSEMYKKGRNDLKSAVDENYGKLAEMLSTGR